MRARRPSGWLVGGLIALVGAASLALLGWTVDPFERLPYWPYIVYSQAALTLAIGLIVAALSVIGLWFIFGLRAAPRPRVPALALPIWIAAAALAFAGSVPSWTLQLIHRDSAQLGGVRYQLAYTVTLENQNVFILYQCDQLGLMCRLRYGSGYFRQTDEHDWLAAPAYLVADEALGLLAIVVDDMPIHIHEAE